MKRLVLLAAFLGLAAPVFAINTTRTQPHAGDRIGILRMPDRYMTGSDGSVAATVGSYLVSELREGGFDAFETRMTYDDLRRNDAENATFYVEIVAADAASREHGGVDIADNRIDVNLALVVAHVAAAVRVYDGRTLELLDTYDLRQDNRAVLPTAVGLGGRHAFVRFAIPFIQYARFRSAAHDVAR
ncbi:MAG: hypothetical protein ABI837_19860, partial [Acidobacteriota bacterium]